MPSSFKISLLDRDVRKVVLYNASKSTPEDDSGYNILDFLSTEGGHLADHERPMKFATKDWRIKGKQAKTSSQLSLTLCCRSRRVGILKWTVSQNRRFAL